jgi:transcriptional regulator with XRE-family HTH domain
MMFGMEVAMKTATRSLNLELLFWRIKMGLSTSDVAKILDMKTNVYESKENNKTSFTLTEMLTLSKLTGLNLEELFG